MQDPGIKGRRCWRPIGAEKLIAESGVVYVHVGTSLAILLALEFVSPVAQRWRLAWWAGVLPDLGHRSLSWLEPVMRHGIWIVPITFMALALVLSELGRRRAWVNQVARAMAWTGGGLTLLGIGGLAGSLAPGVTVATLGLCAVAYHGVRRRWRWAWGWAGLVGVNVVTVVVLWAAYLRSTSAEIAGAPVVSQIAYDVIVSDDGRHLYFTDQEHLWHLDPGAPGTSPAPVSTMEPDHYERLERAGDGEILVAVSSRGVTRLEVPGHAPLARFRDPGTDWTASMAFDPVGGRVWVLNEWGGTGAVFDAATGELSSRLKLDTDTLAVPWVQLDHLARRAYLSSMMVDGDLLVHDLDTLERVDRVPDLFLYQTFVDSRRGLLWGTRPATGELIALQLDGLKVLRAIEVGPLPRDVVVHPKSGEVIVSTYPFGELIRVDGDTGQIISRGTCGWRCRSLYIDAAGVLWTASVGGVHRFDPD